MLRQSPTDPKWFEENVNDFSLSSFLGHLETACDLDKKSSQNEVIKICFFFQTDWFKFCLFIIQPESSNMSTMSESTIDYMSKFEELAQSMMNQEDKQC